MRLHDRYLFREFLAPLLFCLGGLMLLVVASDAFARLAELQERKLHGLEVVEYLALDTPAFLGQVLPFALLVAILAALTQHAKHNEITALRAAGLSLWRLCAPYFLVGLAATAGLFWLNEWAIPRCTEEADALLHRHVRKADDRGLDARRQNVRFYNSGAKRLWSVVDYQPQPPVMRGVTVSWTPPFDIGISIVSNSVTVSRVAVSTTLGGAAGGLSCLLFAVLVDKVWDVTMCLNGALAGLVSITSGCAFFEPWAAIVAGGVGGVLFPLFSRALTRLRVDDPLEARRRRQRPRLPPTPPPPRGAPHSRPCAPGGRHARRLRHVGPPRYRPAG